MFCQKCGNQLADDAKVCDKCGQAVTNNATTIQVNTTAEPKKKKKKKKIGCLIPIILIIIFIFFWSIGKSGSSSDNGDKQNSDNRVSANGSVDEKPEGTIGKFVVTIKDAQVVKSTYEDEDILVVTYTYTNNSDEAKAFSYAVTAKAFQNGIEVESTLTKFGIEDYYDFDNKYKDVQPGYTLDVQEAYKLSDTVTDVNIEITEWISFKDEKLKYTIELGQ